MNYGNAFREGNRAKLMAAPQLHLEGAPIRQGGGGTVEQNHQHLHLCTATPGLFEFLCGSIRGMLIVVAENEKGKLIKKLLFF